MKKLFVAFAFLFSSFNISAQNVGIGVPVPLQKLDINGAIKIGTSPTNQPGTIRYNGGNFEGGNGSSWKSFEGLPIGGLVASKTYNNPTLLNAGFTLAGEMAGITSYNTTTGLLSALQWWPTFLNGVAVNIPPPPPPISSTSPTIAVSTGTLMYVVTPAKLYGYNPVTDVWTIVSNQGLPESSNTKGIWTGTELIFWNGISGATTLGSKYNPTTNTWTSLPSLNSPIPRLQFSIIWDGSRMIVWGGRDAFIGSSYLNTGAFYSPTTNTWTTMSTSGAPVGRSFNTIVWDGTRMIVWGGFNAGGYMNSGGLFNPSTNTWTGATSITNAPSARIYHSAVWTGTEMIIYGGDDFSITNDGGRYNPSSNTWIPTSIIGASNVYKHAASWTGTEMIVTGGNISDNSTNPSSTLSRSYNPISNTWVSLPNFNDAADAKEFHYSFLIANMVVIWSGINKTATNPNPGYNNSGYRYFLTNTISSSTTIINNAPLYLYQKN